MRTLTQAHDGLGGGYALDDARVRQSGTTPFTTARTADLSTLRQYMRQAGSAGEEETYAESFARYYQQGDAYRRAQGNLYSYWASDPLRPRPSSPPGSGS